MDCEHNDERRELRDGQTVDVCGLCGAWRSVPATGSLNTRWRPSYTGPMRVRGPGLSERQIAGLAIGRYVFEENRADRTPKAARTKGRIVTATDLDELARETIARDPGCSAEAWEARAIAHALLAAREAMRAAARSLMDAANGAPLSLARLAAEQLEAALRSGAGQGGGDGPSSGA